MIEKRRGISGKKRPGAVRYALLGGILWLYATVFKRHKVVSELPDGLKPPFLIVGNHSSFYDFVYVIRAFYPERISFVVARKYFHMFGLGWVMKTARAIPKSLFQPDTGTITQMFHILRQGGVVGLFPEGQISISGITIDNGEVIAKFVKKARVPVVGILTGGAYFCNPPWSKNTRKGRVESAVSLVLTQEQARELPPDAIMDKIRHSIRIDNFAWQESAGCLYRGRNLAQGLENILYICPCCHREFTIATQGDSIRCTSCDTRAQYGEDAHLAWSDEGYFRHIGEWLAWQKEREKAQITSQMEQQGAFSISEPVALAMLRLEGNGIEAVGSGKFTANGETYVYSGTLRGETVKRVFPTAGIRYLPFDCGRNFQIYNNDLLYEFRPENPVWCAKIANICEGLFALHEKADLRPRQLR